MKMGRRPHRDTRTGSTRVLWRIWDGWITSVIRARPSAAKTSKAMANTEGFRLFLRYFLCVDASRPIGELRAPMGAVTNCARLVLGFSLALANRSLLAGRTRNPWCRSGKAEHRSTCSSQRDRIGLGTTLTRASTSVLGQGTISLVGRNRVTRHWCAGSEVCEANQRAAYHEQAL
jgi:hypothetical protein